MKQLRRETQQQEGRHPMQSQPGNAEQRDIVLNPGEYAYLQDVTRGQIKTYVGPTVVNQTGQDQPVIFNDGRFTKVSRLEDAVCDSPVAKEGDYIVLENPSIDGKHPEIGTTGTATELKYGRKIIIPGPCQFALHPSQSATVVKGHQLCSNQYLLVRIYNEEEANRNWGNAVIKKAVAPSTNGNDPDKGEGDEGEGDKAAPEIAQAPSELDLAIGQKYIIKGTEFSFYIPPTGVEVVKEGSSYVRDAVTLERLEYAKLVDENGNKRFPRGEAVVFPEPTEEFQRNENGGRTFSAIDLNNISGIHIKVIEPYHDEDLGEDVEAGEMFLTGRECAIYFPRPEHTIIKYGNKEKHFAVAVPKGEGRYRLNRDTSEIETIKGPQMLLPNPVTHVLVRRVLSEKESRLWYPDNRQSAEYNSSLRSLADSSGDQGGYVTDTDISNRTHEEAIRSLKGRRSRESHSDEIAMDSFDRGSSFTRPRELTLNTKYDGVPIVSPWTGFAIQVVSKTGDRRVVEGPASVLLDYDETLEILSLSTSKPKNTDELYQTPYLRIKNNNVSDIISDVRTRDDVGVSIKISMRVNFEGDSSKWFEVENYVKLLCDHVRSMLKGAVRRMDIEAFHHNSVDIVRNIILGDKDEETGERTGLVFKENGMVVVDVEVLKTEIEDHQIKELIEAAQYNTVSANIRLHEEEKQLVIAKRQEEIAQEKQRARSQTEKVAHEVEAQRIALELASSIARIEATLASSEKQREVAEKNEDIENFTAEQRLAREKASKDQALFFETSKNELQLKEIKAETEASVARFESMQEGFAEALLTLSNQETLTKVAEAMSVQSIVGGKNLVETVQKMFADTPVAGLMADVAERAGVRRRLGPSERQRSHAGVDA
jgi:major vault protein